MSCYYVGVPRKQKTMTRIIKRSNGWWVDDGFALWGKRALPNSGDCGYVGFDTKEEAIKLAKSEGLI